MMLGHAQALAKGWTVHKIYAEQVSGKSLNRTAYNDRLKFGDFFRGYKPMNI
jgi:hypothetical protein